MYGKHLPLSTYWVERRSKGDIKAAIETLRQIDEMNFDIETGSMYRPCEALEEMLYYAATENKIDPSQIEDSKIIQSQLRVIRRKEQQQIES